MKKSAKSQKKLPQKERLHLTGTLGGQISEIGFGTLESAKDWIEQKCIPWNQEEAEILRERFHKVKAKQRK